MATCSANRHPALQALTWNPQSKRKTEELLETGPHSRHACRGSGAQLVGDKEDGQGTHWREVVDGPCPGRL